MLLYIAKRRRTLTAVQHAILCRLLRRTQIPLLLRDPEKGKVQAN